MLPGGVVPAFRRLGQPFQHLHLGSLEGQSTGAHLLFQVLVLVLELVVQGAGLQQVVDA